MKINLAKNNIKKNVIFYILNYKSKIFKKNTSF